MVGKGYYSGTTVHKELCRDEDGEDYLILNERQGEFIKDSCNYMFEHLIFNGEK